MHYVGMCLSLFIFVFINVVLLALLQLGYLFLIIALMPTLVAFYVDKARGKPAFQVVFACNLIPALPKLIPMIEARINFRNSDIASAFFDPKLWMFIYMGAATGWCLVFLSKLIAGFFLTLKYEYMVNSLRHEQHELVAEWGEGIIPAQASPAPAAATAQSH